jgi:hypothetical protein
VCQERAHHERQTVQAAREFVRAEFGERNLQPHRKNSIPYTEVSRTDRFLILPKSRKTAISYVILVFEDGWLQENLKLKNR